MDFATVTGLLLGVLSLILGFIFEGGTLGALIQGTAALIVFGGTLGAVILSSSGKQLKKVPFIFKYAFLNKNTPADVTIEQLVELANLSRREGLLALESQREAYESDPFLADGLQMIVDGVDAEMIQDILNRDIELYEENILSVGRLFEAAGGFAPTMGIIGTVMGLIHVLGGLSDPSTLGPAIAVAFIATLYGVASANVIYIPIFNKIKTRLAEEVILKEIQVEGLMSIQYGENTGLLRKKLMAFLDKESKKKAAAAREAGSGVTVSE